ncbi:hypothetical protein [Micromonospora sp. NPDC023644]|uniref:hypothetical protein n=1 Tax=Micromonospora sp. NPDC023644 TaxID=3154321 RepID=UPI0033E3B261
MEPLAAHNISVSVHYGHFVLRDVWCDAGDGGESYEASQDHVAGASTYQLAVRALTHKVELQTRLWPAEPEPEPDGGAWSGWRQLELHCPTGELLVEQITAGAAAEVALPQGAGVYGVRVHGGAIDGTERFLIDLWWQSPLPPDDDDEDFYGDDWS